MKKRYLCPVCEQELVGRYCPECHRLRKEPLIYTGGCLPNERDPDAYTQIRLDAYEGKHRGGHTPAAPASSGKKTGTAKTGTAPGRNDTRYYDTCGTDYKHTYGIPNTDPHRKAASDKKRAAGRGKLVVVFIVICWLVSMFAVPVISLVRNAFPDTRTPSEEAVEAEPAEIPAAYRDYTEEEAMAAGLPCNGYVHYEADGEEYMNIVEGYFSELWPGVSVERNDLGASFWGYENGDGSETTYYMRTTGLVAGIGGGKAELYVTSDAVTGEVLEVEAKGEDRETFQKLALIALCGLEPSADRNELWDRIRELQGEVEEWDGLFDTIGQSDVYFSATEEEYNGSFTCLPEYGKY